MDRRRFLLTSLAGVIAMPLAAEAQPTKVAQIGLLGHGWFTPARHWLPARSYVRQVA